jgi:hypothetical protein
MARLSPDHLTLAQELWLEQPGLVLVLGQELGPPLEQVLGQEPEQALERGPLLLEPLRLLSEAL